MSNQNSSKLFFAGCMAVFFFFSFLTASAQAGEKMKDPEERAKAMTERMKSSLSLTDEQYTKVYELNLKYAKKNGNLLNASSGKLAKFRALKSSQKEKDKEMKKALTKEQYGKYEEMADEMKEKAKDRIQQ